MQKDDRREGIIELSSGCLMLCWGCLEAGKSYAGTNMAPSPKPLADKPKKGGGRVALQVQGVPVRQLNEKDDVQWRLERSVSATSDKSPSIISSADEVEGSARR
jgi:hypothetical protein